MMYWEWMDGWTNGWSMIDKAINDDDDYDGEIIKKERKGKFIYILLLLTDVN